MASMLPAARSGKEARVSMFSVALAPVPLPLLLVRPLTPLSKNRDPLQNVVDTSLVPVLVLRKAAGTGPDKRRREKTTAVIRSGRSGRTKIGRRQKRNGEVFSLARKSN